MICKYACACIKKAGRSLYQFIDNYFQTEIHRTAYVEFINPIPNIEVTYNASDEIYILPSIVKTYPNRPRKKRRAS